MRENKTTYSYVIQMLGYDDDLAISNILRDNPYSLATGNSTIMYTDFIFYNLLIIYMCIEWTMSLSVRRAHCLVQAQHADRFKVQSVRLLVVTSPSVNSMGNLDFSNWTFFKIRLYPVVSYIQYICFTHENVLRAIPFKSVCGGRGAEEIFTPPPQQFLKQNHGGGVYPLTLQTPVSFAVFT